MYLKLRINKGYFLYNPSTYYILYSISWEIKKGGLGEANAYVIQNHYNKLQWADQKCTLIQLLKNKLPHSDHYKCHHAYDYHILI